MVAQFGQNYKEADMSFQLASSKDLGLQHVLENGLALIRDEPIDEERRTQVLESLIKIFSEANRGSQVIQAQNLLFAASDRPAFERFTLFFRYLKDPFGNDLPARLLEAAIVLTKLRDGCLDDEDQRARVGELIESLLAAMEREIALLSLVSPREFHYG